MGAEATSKVRPSRLAFSTKAMAMGTRVFLLDDHEIVRRGVRELVDLEHDLEVVGEAATADDALRGVSSTRPDVAVLDVNLADGNGVEVCREIRSLHPEVRCLMLTSYADDEALLGAIMAGASGFVLKQIRGSELVSSIRRVAAGESLLDARVMAAALERVAATDGDRGELSALTAQERRLLVLIGEGLTNRQIAERMYLAEKTIKNYVSNLLAKLGLSRRTEVAALAARLDERHAHQRIARSPR